MPPKGIRKSLRQAAQKAPTTIPKGQKMAEDSVLVAAPSTPSEDARNRPIYFWREHGEEWGFLSQWYASPFHTEDKSIVYQTAEQYMMYQKAVLFNDPETGALILQTVSPREQKALGRQVRDFDNDVWLKNRERIVEEGSYYKFVNSLIEGEDIRKKLLETGERELVEASPMDKVWGIGFGSKNAEANRRRWGLNLLGRALIRARGRIMEDEKSKKVKTVE